VNHAPCTAKNNSFPQAPRSRFPGVETWNGKKVRIKGVVSDRQSHRRIILRERGQIALVEQD